MGDVVEISLRNSELKFFSSFILFILFFLYLYGFKVKGWIKNCFLCGKFMSENNDGGKCCSFFGGVVFCDVNGSVSSLDYRVSSMCDVVFVGKINIVGGLLFSDVRIGWDFSGVSFVSIFGVEWCDLLVDVELLLMLMMLLWLIVDLLVRISVSFF